MLNSIHINDNMVHYLVPERHDVTLLHVGDQALDCFGNWAEVTSIHGTGIDVHGQAFVCFYTQFGTNSNISHSYKEGELARTVALSNQHTSHELDDIEQEMNRSRTEWPAPPEDGLTW